jgi:hypothetical protein
MAKLSSSGRFMLLKLRRLGMAPTVKTGEPDSNVESFEHYQVQVHFFDLFAQWTP